jgi:hypothetical protein
MAKHLYSQQGAAAQGAQAPGSDGPTREAGKDDVIDAEFEVKK